MNIQFEKFRSACAFGLLSLFVSAQLISQSAYADFVPKAGDRVVYRTKVTKTSGQVVSKDTELKIVQQDSFGRYIVRVLAKDLDTGEVLEETKTYEQQTVVSGAVIRQILQYCPGLGGEIVWFTEGKLSVMCCKLPTASGTDWYGMLPFGMVKRESSFDASVGGRISLEVIAFEFAKR